MRHWIRCLSLAVCAALLFSSIGPAIAESTQQKNQHVLATHPPKTTDQPADNSCEAEGEEEAAELSEEEKEYSARFAALKDQYLQNAPKQITISFAGDCTLGNTPRQRTYQYEDSFEGCIAREGMAYPFEKVRYVFFNDDLTVVNLEGAFHDTERGRVDKTYNFRSATENVRILTLAGVEAVSLGNNHSTDYGQPGIDSTVKTLENAGVGWFGVGEGFNGVYIFEKDGVRIGFISVYYGFWARGGKNGEAIKANIKELQDNNCNLIIAAIHGGVEYDPKHDANQEKMANWMFRNGADMVIGHHPHSIQGMSIANGRTTFWSLGNFVFGGNPKLNYKNPAKNNVLNIETFIAQITFSFDENNQYLGHQINLIPCYMSGGTGYNNYQPVLVAGAEAARVIAAIQADSRPLKLNPYIDGLGALQDFVPAPSGE